MNSRLLGFLLLAFTISSAAYAIPPPLPTPPEVCKAQENQISVALSVWENDKVIYTAVCSRIRESLGAISNKCPWKKPAFSIFTNVLASKHCSIQFASIRNGVQNPTSRFDSAVQKYSEAVKKYIALKCEKSPEEDRNWEKTLTMIQMHSRSVKSGCESQSLPF